MKPQAVPLRQWHPIMVVVEAPLYLTYLLMPLLPLQGNLNNNKKVLRITPEYLQLMGLWLLLLGRSLHRSLLVHHSFEVYLWFKLHMYLNGLTFVLTLTTFYLLQLILRGQNYFRTHILLLAG